MNKDAYMKIAELLQTDDDMAAAFSRCISDPHAYYDENAERYKERFVFSDADEDMVIWLGIVDILIRQGIMFEFDHSEYLGDFIYGMRAINNHDALTIDEDGFDEHADITKWMEALNNAWSEQGFVIAGMDIDSDSYCVMITAVDTFDRLAAEAERTGHKIALAHDL